MSNLWQILFGWLPTSLAIPIAGLFTILIIFLVLRVVKIVLDSLPFL